MKSQPEVHKRLDSRDAMNRSSEHESGTAQTSRSDIVHGGGWVVEHSMGRPRARFFGFLSVIWLTVAICASFPFWDGWPRSFGYLEWLCCMLLLPQPIFVVLALVFLLKEQPRVIAEHRPNPDYDMRKLY
jgi:hypothetical protein